MQIFTFAGFMPADQLNPQGTTIPKKRIKMTHLEYTKKKESIATSDAPIEIREQAMKDLDSKYFKNSTDEARRQIIESASDTSDMESAYE